jgi:hypothetical protein
LGRQLNKQVPHPSLSISLHLHISHSPILPGTSSFPSLTSPFFQVINSSSTSLSLVLHCTLLCTALHSPLHCTALLSPIMCDVYGITLCNFLLPVSSFHLDLIFLFLSISLSLSSTISSLPPSLSPGLSIFQIIQHPHSTPAGDVNFVILTDKVPVLAVTSFITAVSSQPFCLSPPLYMPHLK